MYLPLTVQFLLAGIADIAIFTQLHFFPLRATLLVLFFAYVCSKKTGSLSTAMLSGIFLDIISPSPFGLYLFTHITFISALSILSKFFVPAKSLVSTFFLLMSALTMTLCVHILFTGLTNFSHTKMFTGTISLFPIMSFLLLNSGIGSLLLVFKSSLERRLFLEPKYQP